MRRDQTARRLEFDSGKSALAHIRRHAIKSVVDDKFRSRGSESGADFAHPPLVVDMKRSKRRRGDKCVPSERLVAADHHARRGTVGRMVCGERQKASKVTVTAKAESRVEDKPAAGAISINGNRGTQKT